MTENAEEVREDQVGSDDEVTAKRERIAQLREDIAQAEQEKAARVREESNKVELQMLEAEEARLERELSLIKGTPPPVQPPVLDNPAGQETLVSPVPAATGGDLTPELGQLAGDGAENDDELDEEYSSTTDKE